MNLHSVSRCFGCTHPWTRHKQYIPSQTSLRGCRRAYCQDSITPALKMSVFSKKRASVCEGPVWPRENGGREQTRAATARPALPWSPRARPHHGTSGGPGPLAKVHQPARDHEAPNSLAHSKPSQVHLARLSIRGITATAPREQAAGEKRQENILTRGRMSSSQTVRNQELLFQF